MKSGYPPRALTLIPELPLSSLGLKSGDQLIVNEIADGRPAPQPVAAVQSQKASTSSETPEHVEADGSFLIHRVRTPFPSPELYTLVRFRSYRMTILASFHLLPLYSSKISQRLQNCVKVCPPTIHFTIFNLHILVVADGIQKNPDKFNEAILGYVTTIAFCR